MPRLNDTLVTSKYFDQDFDNFDSLTDWRDIETPQIEKVLRYQYEDQKERDIACAGPSIYSYDDDMGSTSIREQNQSIQSNTK